MCIILTCCGAADAEKITTIRSIEIHGNDRYAQGDILRRMSLAAGKVFSPDILQKDIEHILQLYSHAGYFMARVKEPNLEYNQDSSQVVLSLNIDEGQPFKVGTLEIVGNTYFNTTDIFNMLDTRSTRPFLGFTFERDVEDLLNLYEENGYPFCRIEPGGLRITEGQKIDLLLKIIEGPRVRIGEIFVKGNETTREHVIIRELRLKKGDTYRQSKIDGAKKRLERLGYFNAVSPLSVESVSKDTVDLVVEVEEGKTSTINGVVGYTPAQGKQDGYVTGLIDLSLMNLFGTGRAVDVLWHRRDPSSSNLAFGYEEPWVFGTPLGLGLTLGQIDQDSTYVFTQAALAVTAALTDRLEGRLQFGWERIVPDSTGGASLARSTKYTAAVHAAYDTRDNPLNPRRGLYYQTSIEYGRKRNRATPYVTPEKLKVRLSKFSLDLEHYIPTFSRQGMSIALHGRELQSSEKPIPVSEHFRLGGTTTLRGYREDQFTGTRMAWSNTEYRYLLTSRSRVFLFFDIGMYFRSQVNPDTGTLETIDERKFGYGLGFRLKSRVGIIGLDFGLGEDDSFSQGKIHLQMENRF